MLYKEQSHKHVAPKLFFSRQLHKRGEKEILQTEVITNIIVLDICFWHWYETTQRFARIGGRHPLI
jgi:hypothetical protein